MDFTATELKQNSGQVIDTAQREPARILKHGRQYAAVISSQDYELLMEAKKSEQLKKAVAAGFSQIENDEYSTRSMSDLAAEARKRVEMSKPS